MRLDVLGAGFISLNFIEYAVNKGLDITILDHKICPPDLMDKVDWVQADLSCNKSLLKIVDCTDFII